MKLGSSLMVGLLSLVLAACSSSTDDDSSTPVIDNLDVPSETTEMKEQGQSGPGVVMTLSAHDDNAGIDALHIVFVESGQDHAINIPSAPTKIVDQQIKFLVLNAPQGDHDLQFYVTNTKGRQSASVEKTITVP